MLSKKFTPEVARRYSKACPPASSAIFWHGAKALILSACLLCSAVDAAHGDAPTLPPVKFPPGSGARRLSKPARLARGDTFLGTTELVAFSSTLGLCVEVDHIQQRSRAGGCAFLPPPPTKRVALIGEGYNSTAGHIGSTELFGEVASPTISVIVEYKANNRWRRIRTLLGSLPPSLSTIRKDSMPKWFATDIPGCQERQVRIRALGTKQTTLGVAHGDEQRAACQAGSGYGIRGGFSYGALSTH